MKRNGSREISDKEVLAVIRRLESKIAEQDRRIAEQHRRIVEQSKRIAELERDLAKARKNSSTSSKPPSSDIVKPKQKSKSPRGKKRKIGGQPGHPKHERTPFPSDEIDNFFEYRLSGCPDCGFILQVTEEAPRVLQQVDMVEKPTEVSEHRAMVYWCENCQKFHTASIPQEIVKAGLVGPRLTAVVAYLKGACHASFSTIRKYVRDVLGVTISRSLLRKLVGKVSDALKEAYNELLDRLSSEKILNVDETGHKENGKKFWTWCFRSAAFTTFKISGSRGSDVLFELLGKEFEGVLGCDYFSAYRKYMKDADVLVQFCLAHLIRDIRYLTTLRSRRTAGYGKRLLKAMRELFNLFHSRKALGPRCFKKVLSEKREEIIELAIENVPQTREAQNLANRFRKHGKAYFQFITTPGIDPTNNIAEQAIRFVVIDRLVTQGTRSEKGREWSERIWTVMATCIQQGRSAFNFIYETIQAFFRGEPTPSLVAIPP